MAILKLWKFIPDSPLSINTKLVTKFWQFHLHTSQNFPDLFPQHTMPSFHSPSPSFLQHEALSAERARLSLLGHYVPTLSTEPDVGPGLRGCQLNERINEGINTLHRLAMGKLSKVITKHHKQYYWFWSLKVFFTYASFLFLAVPFAPISKIYLLPHEVTFPCFPGVLVLSLYLEYIQTIIGQISYARTLTAWPQLFYIKNFTQWTTESR